MLRDAVKMDRARIQLGRLSRFGLLELSRQRLRPALSETTHINCPRCSGMGTIRGVESMSLALLRLIGEEARKERTGRVIAQVPVDVATYLMNEKREWLARSRSRDKVSLVIVPNPHLQTPAYNLRRIRDDEKELPENTTVSYQIAEQPALDDSNIGTRDKKPQGEAPLVPSILPAWPHRPFRCRSLKPPRRAGAVAAAGPQLGIFVRLWRWLFGSPAPSAAASTLLRGGYSPQRDRSSHRDARHDAFAAAAIEIAAATGAEIVRAPGRRPWTGMRGVRAARAGERAMPRVAARPIGLAARPAPHEGCARSKRHATTPHAEDRTQRAPRAEGPRSDSRPRCGQAPADRASRARRAAEPHGESAGDRPERRSERGGRGRRRRGRGDGATAAKEPANGQARNPLSGAASPVPSTADETPGYPARNPQAAPGRFRPVGVAVGP